MKFFKKGEKIQFKNSKQTIELDPTYYFYESMTGEERYSWLRRLDLYKKIKNNQKSEDDLGIIEESNKYLKEQIKVGRDASIALLIVAIVAYIDFKYVLFDKVSANSMAFYNILSGSIISGFGSVAIATICETIKNICTKRKLKSIKKEVEKNIEIQKELEKTKSISIKEPVKDVSLDKKMSKSVMSRYELYKNYIIKQGGDSKLFELPAVTQIIQKIIECGDPVVIAEGRSPIYYKDPNKDGTFDICGRTSGHNVNVVYKMEYCQDENPEHFLVLKKYDIENHYNEIGICFDGISYKKIYINKEGNVVEETNKTMISGFEEFETLLTQLHKKKLVKTIS